MDHIYRGKFPHNRSGPTTTGCRLRTPSILKKISSGEVTSSFSQSTVLNPDGVGRNLVEV